MYDAEIELPPTPQAIELRVLPEYEAQPARYQVTLSRIADDDSLTTVGTVGGLAPDDEGFVRLYFDSMRLSKGRYQLTIGGDAGTSAANAVSRFKIRLIEPSDARR